MDLANRIDQDIAQGPDIPTDLHCMTEDLPAFSTIDNHLGLRLSISADFCNGTERGHNAEDYRDHKSCVGVNNGYHNYCICNADGECECCEE